MKWVSVNATGKGFSLVDLTYRYNINEPDAEPAFLLKPYGKLVDGESISLEITASYPSPTSKDSAQQSNMVIMEVPLPSGCILNTEHLNSLKNTIFIIKRTETKHDDTVAIIYFEYLNSKPVNLKIYGYRRHIVTDQKPTPIIIYDYYDNGKNTNITIRYSNITI